MAKSPEKPKPQEIETVPDAWPRFKRFIRDVAKAGPQHRKPTKPHEADQEKKPKSRKRVSLGR